MSLKDLRKTGNLAVERLRNSRKALGKVMHLAPSVEDVAQRETAPETKPVWGNLNLGPVWFLQCTWPRRWSSESNVTPTAHRRRLYPYSNAADNSPKAPFEDETKPMECDDGTPSQENCPTTPPPYSQPRGLKISRRPVPSPNSQDNRTDDATPGSRTTAFEPSSCPPAPSPFLRWTSSLAATIRGKLDRRSPQVMWICYSCGMHFENWVNFEGHISQYPKCQPRAHARAGLSPRRTSAPTPRCIFGKKTWTYSFGGAASKVGSTPSLTSSVRVVPHNQSMEGALDNQTTHPPLRGGGNTTGQSSARSSLDPSAGSRIRLRRTRQRIQSGIGALHGRVREAVNSIVDGVYYSELWNANSADSKTPYPNTTHPAFGLPPNFSLPLTTPALSDLDIPQLKQDWSIRSVPLSPPKRAGKALRDRVLGPTRERKTSQCQQVFDSIADCYGLRAAGCEG
jgi:hypothetical protein